MFSPGMTPFGIYDNDPAFQSDADRIVTYVRQKLGDPVLHVHLSSSQVYTSFEEAVLEYSAVVNQYQAKSTLSQFLGATTGSLSGSENTFPSRLIQLQKKLAEPYGEDSAFSLNGPHRLYSGTLVLLAGQQKYDLQALFSGTVGNQRIRVTRIYHYSPLQAYRFFGTTSAINYLHNQFSFESFTPETVFYLLPIWEDVMRSMQFKTSNTVRRSNYSYEMRNNELMIYPVPQDSSLNLYFEYRFDADPTQPANPQETAAFNGVANLSNVPFGNIVYSKINSVGRQWIRRFSFALAKEVEGQIRSKFTTIPIPNGDLTLNGPELIADARQDQDTMRQELKEILEETTYQNLLAKEAEMSENLNTSLKNVPMGIYIG
jgi:hypothetical protein